MTQSNSQHVSLPDAPQKILVADDELLVAQGIIGLLKTLGFEIIGPCKNGEEAIALVREDKPDMALLDIQMPIMDGMQAAQIIFHEYDVPVVMLTAYSDDTFLRNSIAAGVFGYLLKPASKEQLSAGLSVAWKRYLDHVGQRSEIVDLRQRLDDRKLIEQAKWIIVKRKSISEPEAMQLLQKQSRSSRKSIASVARAVIDSNDLL
ncbi:MAG: response regulator [Phycisphaerae bacterium]|jgi:two-component system, response regulator PdtaR|nr:response regulator [Phycisphaerae bacterium]MBT5366064.1 response regulator [Phycisphaerae bacterium]MBT6269872.1 response regulator [Phycisphaerae bacterium]MBT6282576.1 response regulator [Phycisphaerae bacterium]